MQLEGDLGGLGAAKVKRGQQEAKRESQNDNWWSKERHQGTTRDDKGRQGFGSAAYGRQTGGYGGKFLEFLARIQHALTMHKAWGGGLKMPSAHAADLFFGMWL